MRLVMTFKGNIVELKFICGIISKAFLNVNISKWERLQFILTNAKTATRNTYRAGMTLFQFGPVIQRV